MVELSMAVIKVSVKNYPGFTVHRIRLPNSRPISNLFPAALLLGFQVSSIACKFFTFLRVVFDYLARALPEPGKHAWLPRFLTMAPCFFFGFFFVLWMQKRHQAPWRIPGFDFTVDPGSINSTY